MKATLPELSDLIDTHVHFWDLSLPQTTFPTPEWARIYRSFGPSDFLHAAQGTGVTTCVYIEAGTSAAAARFMDRTAQASPAVAAIAPYIDLADPSLGHTLETWQRNHKVRAVRARLEGHPDPDILTRAETLAGLRQVAARGLAFEFLVSAFQLADIRQVYHAVPDLRGIVEHMGKPDLQGGTDLAAWSEQMRQLAANTPVFCKLSLSPRVQDLPALIAHPGAGWDAGMLEPYVRHLLEQFGPERLMWGSDYPLVLMQSDYAGTLAAMRQALGPLDASQERAIFRTTASQFYKV